MADEAGHGQSGYEQILNDGDVIKAGILVTQFDHICIGVLYSWGDNVDDVFEIWFFKKIN